MNLDALKAAVAERETARAEWLAAAAIAKAARDRYESLSERVDGMFQEFRCELDPDFAALFGVKRV